MQKNCAAKRHQQDDADKSVRGKERCIQPSEIVSTYQPVLIDQQSAGRDHAGECDWSKSGCHEQTDERDKGRGVKRT